MGIKFYLANLKIHGLEFSKTNKGNIRNLITLSVQGMQLELYIDPDVWSGDINDFKGKFIESGYILAKDATISKVPELREIVSNICTLLSLGTDSQVRFFKWESLDLSHSDKWCVNGFYNFYRPPISIKHPERLKYFIENCYGNFSDLRDKHTLVEAIELFVSSESLSMPVELKLATIFILLENLKSSYAKSAGYVFEKGYFRKGSTKGTFDLLLNEMFASVGISQDLTSIKNLRNEIIHSGLSELPIDEKMVIFSICKELSAEYLLKLLGYDGLLNMHTKNGNTTKSLTNNSS